MRPSLETIEFIENYLLGNFDPEEHEQAKQRIESSEELTQLLETQQCIYIATRRKALRAEIQSYAPVSGTSFFKQYRSWFIGGLAVLAIIYGALVFTSNWSMKPKSNQQTRSFIIPKNEREVIPWIPFDTQYFDLVAEKGATIVGKDGTLILLAANSLLDANGNRVSGKVQAELIEAIDWEDMLAYNLTITSEGKALSSGGMMRIRYHQEGKEVFVDPERPMHVEIPTDHYDPEMKVWEGEVTETGLNWKNPQEIERFLTTVDLNQLDFIPTGFDAEVASLLPYNGHTVLSKELVDSLYYSIAANRTVFDRDRTSRTDFKSDCGFIIPKREDITGYLPGQTRPLLKGNNSVTAQIVDENANPIVGMSVILHMDKYLEHEEEIVTDENGYFTFGKLYAGEVTVYASLASTDYASPLHWKYCLETTFECPKSPKNFTLKKPLVAQYSSVVNFSALSVQPKTDGVFIDPLTIKTLKTARFQNTFIATKEFEERLQAMHRLKNGTQLLDLYITHLSEPLWKCDERAAKLLSGDNKQIFEAFATQRLTNVQNNDLHQEALTAHYIAQRAAFRKENETRIKNYQSKTSQQIQQLKNTLKEVLDTPSQLATAQAIHKGRIPSSEMISQIESPTSNSAIRTLSYSFSWSSRSWCNLDRYTSSLGTSPWTTSISTNINDKNVVVYRTIREMQTILSLSAQEGIYTSVSSKAGKDDNVVCVAMHHDPDSKDQLYYGSVSFDPKTIRNTDLNLKLVTESEFYTQLCSLSPAETLIAHKLRHDYIQLNALSEIRKKTDALKPALLTARNQLSKEILVYNRLFEFLDMRNKGLVQ